MSKSCNPKNPKASDPLYECNVATGRWILKKKTKTLPKPVQTATKPVHVPLEQEPKVIYENCVAMSTSKYINRKSPPYPANQCPEGMIKDGNDGNPYIVVNTIAGIHRWVPYKGEKHLVKFVSLPKKIVQIATKVIHIPPKEIDKCVSSTAFKYLTRKSPPYPANDCPVGTIKLGNDGKEYIISKNANGTHRWLLQKKDRQPKKDLIVVPLEQVIQELTQIAYAPYDVAKGVMEYKQLRPREVQENKEKILGRYVDGYYVSVKYDGWQGVWDGNGNFTTKTGKIAFAVPQSWNQILPKNIALAGELIIDGKSASDVASLRKPNSPFWENTTFKVFDLPGIHKPFSERTVLLKNLVTKLCKDHPKCPVEYIDQIKIGNVEELYTYYKKIIMEKGEGLVLTKADSLYSPGSRTSQRVKLKGREDIEGTVIGYKCRQGDDIMKSLIVRLDSGKTFSLGIGFKNTDRVNYKSLFPIGTMVKFSYREMTSNGVPKEARFLQVRRDT